MKKCNNRASSLKTAKGLGSQVNYSVQNDLSEKELVAGDTSHRIPIILSDGKTIVFAKPASNIDEVKKRWEKLINRLNP